MKIREEEIRIALKFTQHQRECCVPRGHRKVLGTDCHTTQRFAFQPQSDRVSNFHRSFNQASLQRKTASEKCLSDLMCKFSREKPEVLPVTCPSLSLHVSSWHVSPIRVQALAIQMSFLTWELVTKTEPSLPGGSCAL